MRILFKGAALYSSLAGFAGSVVVTPVQSADIASASPPVSIKADNQHASQQKLQIGDENSNLLFYGHINKGLLIYDDGLSTLGYFPVDNDISSTRFGLKLLHRSDGEWSMGANAEAEWEPYSTDYVNQLNRGKVDWDTLLLRHAEVYINAASYGTLWLGQGRMASDTTAEVDLSGTSVIGRSSVAKPANTQFYRFSDGTLSDVQIGSTFNNLDGLGRKLRVRFDSARVNGFALSASVGKQVYPKPEGDITADIALRFIKETTDYVVSAAAAYSWPGGDSQGLFSGSASVLNIPTGLSATIAGGYQRRSEREQSYGYGKLGYQVDYIDIGRTSFSVDAYIGNNINSAMTESLSIGFQAVQSVDAWQTEIYLGARSYRYDDNSKQYQKGFAVLSGVRFKF